MASRLLEPGAHPSLWTDTWPPNSTAILTEGDSSGGKMLNSVSKVDRYRKDRCAELAKEASPPFLAEIYRRVAVRYVFIKTVCPHAARWLALQCFIRGLFVRPSRSTASSLGSKEPRIVAFEQYGRGLEGPRAAQHISSPLVRPSFLAFRVHFLEQAAADDLERFGTLRGGPCRLHPTEHLFQSQQS